MFDRMYQYTEKVFFHNYKNLTSLVKHLDGKQPKKIKDLLTYFNYKANCSVTEGK